MEDTAANLTGDSKGAERRRGGGPMALRRRIELGRAALVGDVGGARGLRSSAPTARWGGGARAAEVGGARGRRRRRAGGAVGAGDDGGATQIKKTTKCWERGEEEGRYRGGAFCPGWSHDPGQKDLLSWVVASSGTKDPPFQLVYPHIAIQGLQSV